MTGITLVPGFQSKRGKFPMAFETGVKKKTTKKKTEKSVYHTISV